MKTRLLVLLMILVAVMPIAASAQDLAPAAGLQDSASRSFISATGETYGLWSATVWVATFDTEANASAALIPWFDEAKASFAGTGFVFDALAPIGVETIGDETLLQTGPVAYTPDSSYDDVNGSLLAIRQGTTVFTFALITLYSDPVEPAIALASVTLGITEPAVAPVPGVDYMTGGLWDLLPRIEALPIGMTWKADFQPCGGLFASVECSSEATPEGTP
jgi:hypothetical protein